VAVMVMMFFAIFDDRDHASVGGLAERMLELDCRVIDSKIMQQPFFHVAQDAFAHGWRNISN